MKASDSVNFQDILFDYEKMEIRAAAEVILFRRMKVYLFNQRLPVRRFYKINRVHRPSTYAIAYGPSGLKN